jgi:hypothetical protein
MGGSLMQIVAKGVQDTALTGNPQISFFKVVYKRHTNFGIETLSIPFDSTPFLGKKVSCTLPRNGDLVSRMYLMIKLPELKQIQSTDDTDSTYVAWVNGLGNSMIKTVSIDIGGQEIDKHYGEWMDIWNELNLSEEKKYNYNKMVYNISQNDRYDPSLTFLKDTELTLYVPLLFWFNRNPGLALPLIALQYHAIEIHVEFEDVKSLIRNDNGSIIRPETKDSTVENPEYVDILHCELLVDYVYLDLEERNNLATKPQEYLIDQLQYNGKEVLKEDSPSTYVKLNYNHPIKNINWVIQDKTFLTVDSKDIEGDTMNRDGGNQKLRYSSLAKINNSYDTFKTGKIQLNGHDRITEKNADYFRIVQPYQHYPGSTGKYVYSYSFGINPSEHQPSGTCNFSRIDDAKLFLTFDTTTKSTNKKDDTNSYTGQIPNEVNIKVYSVNYNVLRIDGGMGGIAYSN